MFEFLKKGTAYEIYPWKTNMPAMKLYHKKLIHLFSFSKIPQKKKKKTIRPALTDLETNHPWNWKR